MKKYLLFFGIFIILLAGCGEEASLPKFIPSGIDIHRKQISKDLSHITDIHDYLVQVIINYEQCHMANATFADYTLLEERINTRGNTEYALLADGQGYLVMENGRLSQLCGFSDIPTLIEITKNGTGYKLVRYETAKDGEGYYPSIVRMFSENAIVKINKKYAQGHDLDFDFMSQADIFFEDCSLRDIWWDEHVQKNLRQEQETCKSEMYYSSLRMACLGIYQCTRADGVYRNGIIQLNTNEQLLTCNEGKKEIGTTLMMQENLENQRCKDIQEKILDDLGI